MLWIKEVEGHEEQRVPLEIQNKVYERDYQGVEEQKSDHVKL